jgi:uncharacterized membrane protein (Fun14 family)
MSQGAPVQSTPPRPAPSRSRTLAGVVLVGATAALLAGILLDGGAAVLLRNVGGGVLGGYALAHLLRRFLVPTIVVVGLLVAAAWGLAELDLVHDAVHPRELVLAAWAWLTDEVLMLERLALHVLPAAVAGGVGFAAGLRR